MKTQQHAIGSCAGCTKSVVRDYSTVAKVASITVAIGHRPTVEELYSWIFCSACQSELPREVGTLSIEDAKKEVKRLEEEEARIREEEEARIREEGRRVAARRENLPKLVAALTGQLDSKAA